MAVTKASSGKLDLAMARTPLAFDRSALEEPRNTRKKEKRNESVTSAAQRGSIGKIAGQAEPAPLFVCFVVVIGLSAE